jgi:hypothetical protein
MFTNILSAHTTVSILLLSLGSGCRTMARAWPSPPTMVTVAQRSPLFVSRIKCGSPSISFRLKTRAGSRGGSRPKSVWLR